MVKVIITFGHTEVEKHKFHHHQNLILSGDVDIKKNTNYFVIILLVTNIMIIKLNYYA